MENEDGWTVVSYKKKKTIKKQMQEIKLGEVNKPKWGDEEDEMLPTPLCYKSKKHIL